MPAPWDAGTDHPAPVAKPSASDGTYATGAWNAIQDGGANPLDEIQRPEGHDNRQDPELLSHPESHDDDIDSLFGVSSELISKCADLSRCGNETPSPALPTAIRNEVVDASYLEPLQMLATMTEAGEAADTQRTQGMLPTSASVLQDDEARTGRSGSPQYPRSAS